MHLYINNNGEIIPAGQLVLPADNRSYRYGDGLFETMKVADGRIIFDDYHFERLEKGMQLLQFKVPALFGQGNIRKEIIGLCQKNNCENLARVRLSVSRGSGGLLDSDNMFQYIVECWPLDKSNSDQGGLVIDIFPDARKSCDVFSNLKSANYLPYVMASQFSKKNKLDESLILNTHDRICDGTVANVFWVKKGIINTPPLSEGCVAGVMRRNLLEKMKVSGYKIQEKVFNVADLLNAEEVFLTNAIQGIRWVKQFRDKAYSSTYSQKTLQELI